MLEPLEASAGSSPYEELEQHLLPNSLRRIALLSFMTIVVALGGTLLWAACAQIESAVPASGVVVASGKRKTITVIENGLLRELLVREGDHVSAGQVVLRLDDVQIRVVRDQAKTQYWAAVAKATRLTAEALDSRKLTIPDDLREAASMDPAIAAAVTAEVHQFGGSLGCLRRFRESARAKDRPNGGSDRRNPRPDRLGRHSARLGPRRTAERRLSSFAWS